MPASTRGKEPSTNEPVDWPWSKRVRAKYGKNVAFNKPLPESIMLPKIVVDNKLTKEATQRGDSVLVGPKFFKLSPESKRSVLYHEFGHWYRDRFIGLAEIMGWAPGEGFFGLFDTFTSEEGFAEAFAVYFVNPSELKQRYPEAYDKIKAWVKGKESMVRGWVDKSNIAEQAFDDPMTPDEKEALKRNKKDAKTKAEALIEAVIALREGLVDDAKRNLVAAGLFDADSDYDGMLGSAVLELVKKFAAQGHSGASAHLTLELFDKVAKRKPLTVEFWYEEKQRLLKWLKDEGQLDGKHAMTQEMVDRFILDSLGPCPRTRVNEAMESINVEELINEVVSGKTPDEAIDEAFARLKRFGAAVKRGVGAVRRGVGAVRRGVKTAQRKYHTARRKVKRFRLKRAIRQGQRVQARKAKVASKAAAKVKRQQQRTKFKSSMARLRRGEAQELDTYALIECVLEGMDPGRLLAEKVSYSYDIRLGQNIETGPVVKDEQGKFVVRRAYNVVTGDEGHCEPAQPKE